MGIEKDIQSKVLQLVCVPHASFVLVFPIQFIESQFEIRSDVRHSYHCDVLERSDLSPADQQHFSIVYGVNRRALLNTSEFFSVTSGALIPDIMHDVLEGVLPLEVKLMLNVSQFLDQNKHLHAYNLNLICRLS